MSTHPKGRPVVLSSPSGVGQRPLDKALDTFYPERRESLQNLLTGIMRRKLLRRTRRRKLELSAKDLENTETRASSAYLEIKDAWHSEFVIPNHQGEDRNQRDSFYYRFGNAREPLNAFAALLGRRSSNRREEMGIRARSLATSLTYERVFVRILRGKSHEQGFRDDALSRSRNAS